MSAIAAGIASGHYARKQLHGAGWFITWIHRRRFQLACRLAAEFHGRRLLDYGCGDGTFMAMTCGAPDAPAMMVGVEAGFNSQIRFRLRKPGDSKQRPTTEELQCAD
jgi:hypothetical protein